MTTVLIIDDDPRIREIWTEALRGAGFSVRTAESGAAGVEIVQSELIDVVITDIVMPEKNGIETLLEIKTSRPHIKVLAVSGGGEMLQASFVEIADRLGADATLQKPVPLNHLCRIVGELALAR